jgi:hypothetical protein
MVVGGGSGGVALVVHAFMYVLGPQLFLMSRDLPALLRSRTRRGGNNPSITVVSRTGRVPVVHVVTGFFGFRILMRSQDFSDWPPRSPAPALWSPDRMRTPDVWNCAVLSSVTPLSRICRIGVKLLLPSSSVTVIVVGGSPGASGLHDRCNIVLTPQFQLPSDCVDDGARYDGGCSPWAVPPLVM